MDFLHQKLLSINLQKFLSISWNQCDFIHKWCHDVLAFWATPLSKKFSTWHNLWKEPNTFVRVCLKKQKLEFFSSLLLLLLSVSILCENFLNFSPARAPKNCKVYEILPKTLNPTKNSVNFLQLHPKETFWGRELKNFNFWFLKPTLTFLKFYSINKNL